MLLATSGGSVLCQYLTTSHVGTSASTLAPHAICMGKCLAPFTTIRTWSDLVSFSFMMRAKWTVSSTSSHLLTIVWRLNRSTQNVTSSSGGGAGTPAFGVAELGVTWAGDCRDDGVESDICKEENAAGTDGGCETTKIYEQKTMTNTDMNTAA